MGQVHTSWCADVLATPPSKLQKVDSNGSKIEAVLVALFWLKQVQLQFFPPIVSTPKMKLYLDFHRLIWPWRRTLTNGSDIKYVFPRRRKFGVLPCTWHSPAGRAATLRPPCAPGRESRTWVAAPWAAPLHPCTARSPASARARSTRASGTRCSCPPDRLSWCRTFAVGGETGVTGITGVTTKTV